MADDPFARRAQPIPVTVVTRPGIAADADGVAVLRLSRGAHEHLPGQECAACNALADVRAHLFDLGEQIRTGATALPARVIVDASSVGNPQAVVDAVAGKLPATGLRDHTVARNFRLDGVD